MKSIISILIESPFYFEIKLKERLLIIKRILGELEVERRSSITP